MGREPRTVLAHDGYRWREELALRFRRIDGRGTLLCVDCHPGEAMIPLFLEAAREGERLIVVQHGGGGSAFAKTFFHESKGIRVAVVDVPYECSGIAEWVAAEAAHAPPFSEVVYDAAGNRYRPILRPSAESAGEVMLGPADVLLVTGGGKGISAECALELARETGVRLAIVGRSSPHADAEVAANLARISAAGVTARYFRGDVVDAEAMRLAVAAAQAELGPITAVLHGAGANTPRLLGALNEEQFRATVAPKTGGLDHILNCLDGSRLRLCLAFGSLIARTGMRGEGDYAVANEWLRLTLDGWAERLPHCRCLTVEWSLWSGVGMGQRLGRVEALAQSGISPLPIAAACETLRQLALHPPASRSVVVTGRFAKTPTLRGDTAELPLLRFVGALRVHYPGIEIVSDVTLSTGTDLYLDDHRLQGQCLFPAVIGLEAMAQAATALVPSGEPVVFEDVRFLRPITVAKGTGTKIRIAALAGSAGEIEVAIRSEHTAFQADHFRAVCRLGNRRDLPLVERREVPAAGRASLDAGALYGTILFQSGRFRRVARYLELRSKECVAELAAAPPSVDWFSGYLPAQRLLGDAGARDAAIHAIQACVPQSTVLPVAVDRIELRGSLENARYAAAKEIRQEGTKFIYDLSILDADGEALELWSGLVLQVAAPAALRAPMPALLLTPYLERRVRELTGCEIRLDLERGHVRNGNGLPLATHRPDGRPDTGSSAYSGDYKLALRSEANVGCDLEAVHSRPKSQWRQLLGRDYYLLAEQIAAAAGEEICAASTRVWTAKESLKKAGMPEDMPLLLVSNDSDGFVLLSAGGASIATLPVEPNGDGVTHIVGVLAGADAPGSVVRMSTGVAP